MAKLPHWTDQHTDIQLASHGRSEIPAWWQEKSKEGLQPHHERQGLLHDQQPDPVPESRPRFQVESDNNNDAQDSNHGSSALVASPNDDGTSEISPGSQLQGQHSPFAAGLDAADSTNEGEAKSQNTTMKDLFEWQTELAFCFVFLLPLGAIVLTLLRIKDKPLPNWSINSVLSFYTIVFKGSLVSVIGAAISQNQWRWFSKERQLYDFARFDSAGREPLGSARWLRRYHFREPITAFGALILILAILIDPFIQQLVQYTDCSMNITQSVAVASIPRTNWYSPPMLHVIATEASPLPDQVNPWNLGALSNPPDVSFDCSTGNCTFPTEYSTVGYCTSCNDTSDTLSLRCNDTDDASPSYNISLPSGLNITPTDKSYYIERFTLSYDSHSTNFEMISTGDLTCDNVTNTLVSNTNCENASSSTDWTCRGYGAASCSIGPCIRTYKASIQAGRLEEVLLSSTTPWDQWLWNGYYNMTMIDTDCISESEKNDLKNRGFIINPESRWLGPNRNESYDYLLERPFPNSMMDRGCMYIMDRVFAEGFLNYYLGGVLQGTVIIQAYYNWTINLIPPALERMYNNGENNMTWVEDILNNATTSLTNHIRQTGDSGYSRPAQGIVSHFATCVDIQWKWFTFPAALAGLTILLLALSILASRKDNAPVWKSSPLAFILHANLRQSPPTGTYLPSQPPSAEATLPTSMEAMKKHTKNIYVKLDRSESSIRLQQTRRDT